MTKLMNSADIGGEGSCFDSVADQLPAISASVAGTGRDLFVVMKS